MINKQQPMFVMREQGADDLIASGLWPTTRYEISQHPRHAAQERLEDAELSQPVVHELEHVGWSSRQKIKQASAKCTVI